MMHTRWAAALALAACVIVPGCITIGDPGNDTGVFLLQVYEYRYTGDDTAVKGHPYGWLVRVHNPTDEALHFMPVPPATDGGVTAASATVASRQATAFPDGPDGGVFHNLTAPIAIAAGASDVVLFRVLAEGIEGPLSYSIGQTAAGSQSPLAGAVMRRAVDMRDAAMPVQPGDHVQTGTVGVWSNGTSFYTNIADLNADPAFPAGYDRSRFGGAPLPVYVYDADRTEQPPGSADRCYFTTIPGYNDLLKSQAEGATNVRFLQPEEAYTREGNEDHDLYGDALIFMNTVVAHDGATDMVDEAPDPTGECFDPENTVPLPPIPPIRGDTLDTKP